ncbi:WxL protein peptidoglycan domain-containing protein [Companilactobacillus furfuricola]|uniref:WxL protein peptidoglycan domain-containing protein n=1 Tax=Companilactobacillus furfuricola TaxID=1462575 RepID=UPI000F7B65AC|nr:DUF916 domain-containing protein [Companilactobacillus furfuricola]
MICKKLSLLFGILVMACCGFVFSPNIASADIQSVSVTPIVSDDEDPSFFQLSGQPGSVKELKLSLTNFGDMPIQLRVQPTNATTSTTGKLDFDEKVTVGDYGLRHAFSDMTNPQTVMLKNDQTKDLTFKVKLPSQPLAGTVIGGFDVYDVKHPNDGHSGVAVYFDSTPTKNNHLIKFDGIVPKVQNKQPFLMVNLANYSAETIKNTIVQVKVKKNNWYNKLGLDNQISVQDVKFDKIAPNSKIPIEFNQKQTPIASGNYLVEGVVKNGRDAWHFKQNVKVDPVAADQINQQAKNLIYDKTGLYLTIIGVLTAVIVLIFWGISYQRRYS